MVVLPTYHMVAATNDVDWLLAKSMAEHYIGIIASLDIHAFQISW